MNEPFELEWFGGSAEHHFRKARPRIGDLPWNTLDPKRYPPELINAARSSWTQTALSEYRAAVAFSEVVRVLLEAKAPLDIVGMASDFLADEVSHVEIVSRVAVELGGGARVLTNFEDMYPRADPNLTPFQRANDTLLAVGCIAETFSGGTAAGHMRVTTHPLTRSVYELLVADEARHSRLGWLYFEWASDRIDDDERHRLGRRALRVLEGHAPLWRRRVPASKDGETALGFRVSDMNELGSMETTQFNERARHVVQSDILDPLALLGIVIEPEERDRLLA